MRRIFFAALLALPLLGQAADPEPRCISPDQVDQIMDGINTRHHVFSAVLIIENEKWQQFKDFYQKNLKTEITEEAKSSDLAQIYLPVHGQVAKIVMFKDGCVVADGEIELLAVLAFLENEKKKVAI